MAPAHGDTSRTSLSLLLVLVLLLIFCVSIHSIITYNRQTLLDIRHCVYNAPSELLSNFVFSTGSGCNIVGCKHTRKRGSHGQHTRKRGSRGGLLARLRRRPTRPPVPSILLANVQSISNKLDELHCCINSQRDMRECCVLCFSETWLTSDTPDTAVQPDSFSLHRLDRHAETTGKAKGGGVCLLVNNSWCTDVEVISRCSSPVLEHLTIKCRPFYSPRELPSVLITAVYIPPQAKAAEALEELYTAISGYEDKYLQAVSIVAGDFNHCSLKSVLPKYYQHISCPTRGDKILDHFYSTIKGAYRSIP